MQHLLPPPHPAPTPALCWTLLLRSLLLLCGAAAGGAEASAGAEVRNPPKGTDTDWAMPHTPLWNTLRRANRLLL